MPTASTAKITDYAKWLESSPRKLYVVFSPDPGPECFTGAFDAQPPMDNFASVNASNGISLEVGGTGVNAQFERDLASAGHSSVEFQNLHQSLFALACQRPGTLVDAEPGALSQHRGLKAAFAMVGGGDGRAFVAIDIFKDRFRPFHCENVAMVYCVWPDRRNFQNNDDFREVVLLVGEVLAYACNIYNARVANDLSNLGLPPLWRVRMGLAGDGDSSGVISDDLIATSVLEGLIKGTAFEIEDGFGKQPGDEMEFEMAHNGGVFQPAWEALQHKMGM